MLCARKKEEQVADLELARAAAKLDDKARHDLAERLFDRVRGTVHYLVAGDDEADDLTQIALVEILRCAENFRGDGRLEAWADRITVRTVMRALEKRRRWWSKLIFFGAPEEGSTRGDQQPEGELSRRQLQQRLGEKLKRLSIKLRVVVVLHWVHGHTVAEVAEICDAKVNTVRDRLRTAKKKLKKMVLADPALAPWFNEQSIVRAKR